MSDPWHLGNDVVDLHHHGGSGKGTDSRFLARVCCQEEEEIIRSSADPDRVLWLHWSGKEAIYKSASKVLGSPPVFHHIRFQVAFPGLRSWDRGPSRAHEGATILTGTGRFEELVFSLSMELTGRYVHALAWIPATGGGSPAIRSFCVESAEDPRGPATGLREDFSALEWKCVSHRASGLTRLRAREALAAELDIPEALLEIRCGPGPPGRRIPSVWLRDEEIGVDLTLSHHGRYLAWAFLTQSVAAAG